MHVRHTDNRFRHLHHILHWSRRNMQTVFRFLSSYGLWSDLTQPARGASSLLRHSALLHRRSPEEKLSFPGYRFPNWWQPEVHIRSFLHPIRPLPSLSHGYVHCFHMLPSKSFQWQLPSFLSCLLRQLPSYNQSVSAELPLRLQRLRSLRIQWSSPQSEENGPSHSWIPALHMLFLWWSHHLSLHRSHWCENLRSLRIRCVRLHMPWSGCRKYILYRIPGLSSAWYPASFSFLLSVPLWSLPEFPVLFPDIRLQSLHRLLHRFREVLLCTVQRHFLHF